MTKLILLGIFTTLVCALLNIFYGNGKVNTLEYWVEAMVLFLVAFIIIFLVEIFV